jgi:hypothetical protein
VILPDQALNRFARLAFLLLAVAAAACVSSAPAPPAGSVVLPPEQLERALWLCSRSGPSLSEVEGTWEVTPEVVARLEADLPRLGRLRPEECCLARGPIRQPERFFRQYVGIVLGGREVVYVNAFRSVESDPDWRQRAVQVCDGGDDYWGAIYDPATRRFSRLAFNGEA